MSDRSVTIGSTVDGPFPWKVWVQQRDGTWIEFGAFRTEQGAHDFVFFMWTPRLVWRVARERPDSYPLTR